MGEMISHNSEQQAELARKVLVKKVSESAKKMFEVGADEKDSKDKKSELAQGILGSLGLKSSSVEELINVQNDENKTETQKGLAKISLSVLSQGLAAAMVESKNDGVLMAIGTGSIFKIENQLPQELKGVGGEIRNNRINEPGIIEVLNPLDLIRKRTKNADESAKRVLKKELEVAHEKLIKLTVDDKKEGQLETVTEYLGKEISELGDFEFGKNRLVEADQRINRGAYDHKTYGEVEGMEGIRSTPIPGEQLVKLEQVKNEEDAKKWISSTLVKMSENPLFFATWWQQGPADQVVSMINEQLRYSMHDDEYAGMRDYVYATVSVLGLQTVDRNADANSDSYGQFTPPKNMAGFLHWDNDHKYFDTLRKDSDIKTFYEKIFNTAFDKKNFERAKQIIEAFSDGAGYDSQNKYLKSLLENKLFPEKKSKDVDLINKGRVAMAIFEVDFMPEWIRWLNASKRYFAENDDGKNYQKLDWLESFRDIDGIQNPTRGKYKTFAYSVKLGFLKTDEKGRVVKDETGKDIEIELGYEHPRVLRPWDVAAGAKGSYRDRPGIIWGMEKVLAPFIARRLSTKDGKHWITAHGNNAIDLYSKYGKFMSKVFGGTQGTEFDNLTSLDEILPLAANFWGQPGEPVKDKNGAVIETAEENRESFGNFLSDLFSLKTDAMFYPGYRSNAKRTLNAIEGLDLFSGEMEKKKALEGALGPNANIAHGWVAEVRRLYNIDLLALDREGYPKYQRFYDAYLRIFIDTPDVKEAREYLAKAKRITKRKGLGEIASSISNIINIWSK